MWLPSTFEFQVAGNLFSDLYSGRQAALEQRCAQPKNLKWIKDCTDCLTGTSGSSLGSK